MERPIMEALYWLLIDGGFPETVRMFEQETRIYFNFNYFDSLIMNGDYDRAMTYLSAFSPQDDNPDSIRMFHKLFLEKGFEAVSSQKHGKDNSEGRESLVDELKYLLKKNPRTRFKLNCPIFNIRDFHETITKMWNTQNNEYQPPPESHPPTDYGPINQTGDAPHPAAGAGPSAAAPTIRPLSPGNFEFIEKGTKVSEATPTATASGQGPSVNQSSDAADLISIENGLRFEASKRAARPSEQSSPQPEGSGSGSSLAWSSLPPKKRHGRPK